MSPLNRREFIKQSAAGFGAFMIAQGLSGCGAAAEEGSGTLVSYEHGVASGDPLSDRVIIWTRVTPDVPPTSDITVGFEVASDEAFTQLVTSGQATTNESVDYTIKVDATELEAGQVYYYRFVSNGVYSPIGKTRTLPTGSLDQLKLGVVSCANHAAGYFHVYAELANRSDIDFVLHLGDYIYEYGMGGYATEDAERLGRVPEPATEITALNDYRTRYRSYRSDADLQHAHLNHPFICVWDDHEVCNDAWKTGAENHSSEEGVFSLRKKEAFQAYFEWLPVRPPVVDNQNIIYRRFQFGDLVDLYMLDTRHLARTEPLAIGTYLNLDGTFEEQTFHEQVEDESRTLLGADQLGWLKENMGGSAAKWQVLGQQVLMGRMELPGSIATQSIAIVDYVDYMRLFDLKKRESEGSSLSSTDQAYLNENREKLTPEVENLLVLPGLPYNLDAWDGFPVERDDILNFCIANDKDLVVLAGDTHNAWGSNLITSDGEQAGVEFATASVSSPGLEEYLHLDTASAVQQGELGAVGFVNDLLYSNMSERGYMVVTFDGEKAQSEWNFVNTIKEEAYSMLENRRQELKVLPGADNRRLIWV